MYRDRFDDSASFVREFNGLKRFTAMTLPDPGQLALLHVGQNESDGYFYYVMELADDVNTGREVHPETYSPRTLKEVRARQGRLQADECVKMGIEISRALGGLHSRGLVHRDIKPSNIIMLGGVPKLADIGLMASASDARTFVGTEGYVPPEGPGKPSADVFALGKMLYEMATGLDRQDYPRLPDGMLKFPDRKALLELNEVILRSCDPQESRRYPDGAAVLRDLLALQAGHSLRARRNFARKLRLTAALTVVLGAALEGYWWMTRPAPSRATPPPEIRQLLTRAWEQMNKMDAGNEGLELADGFCKRAIELDPTSADAWSALSQVNTWYVGWGIDASARRRQAARTDAERALKLAPGSYEARLAQACYLARAAVDPGSKDLSSSFLHEAERMLNQLLRENPDEPRALRCMGSLQMEMGQPDSARETLTRLTRSPLFAAWAWYTLAMLEEQAGSIAAAEAAIIRSLAVEPMAASFNFEINKDLLWHGDLAAAKAIVDMIPASMTQDDALVWWIYSVYYWRREPEKQLAYLQSLSRDWIDSANYNGPTALLIGNAHWMAGRRDVARMEWKSALSLVERRLADHPTDGLELDWKGVLLGRLGEYPEAEKFLKLAAQAAGVECFDWGDLFELKMAEGQLDTAMDIEERQWEPHLSAAYLEHCPFFDPLRSNPRFIAVLARAKADPKRSPDALRAAAKAQTRN